MPFDNCPEHERALERAGTGDFGRDIGNGAKIRHIIAFKISPQWILLSGKSLLK
ncbi:MAG: hypothetical protein Q8O06_01395 [Acetobacterium sp.]|nr:hypothetical protein [Acetobacterium sp.]